MVAGGVAGGIRGVDAQEAAGSRRPPRQPSPALAVGTLDGAVINVHQQQGKVVLLDFMTTGCPTCKVASAGIERVYRELRPNSPWRNPADFGAGTIG